MDFVDSCNDSIWVGLGNVGSVSKYNIFFYLGGSICSVLHVLFYASVDRKFMSMLESGRLVAEIGRKYLSIEFCGNYIPYVMKLIVMYRDTEKIRQDLLDGGL